MPDADRPLPAPAPVPAPVPGVPTQTPAADAPERLHVEAYRTRDRAWTDPVAPADFFASQPDLAVALPTPAPPSRPGVGWIANAAIAAVLLALVAAHDWKLSRWFRPLAVAQRVNLTPQPAPRPPGRLSAITRTRVETLNAAIERGDWTQAAQLARRAMQDPVAGSELRRDPSAWLWLGDVAVAAAVAAADLLDGEPRRQLYRDAVAAHQQLVADGTLPGLLADYGHTVAAFHLQGGAAVAEGATPPPERAAAENLLATLGQLRSRFGPELDRSRAFQDRLLLVEGWTLARRLCETARSVVFPRFDRAAPHNQRRWERLASLLDLDREHLAAERDFLRLRLFFWETAHSFCFNPLSANENVQIGTWTASEPVIETRIAEARRALGLAP